MYCQCDDVHQKVFVKSLQNQFFFMNCWRSPPCWSLIFCKTYKFLCNMWCGMCDVWCMMCDVPDLIFCKILTIWVKGKTKNIPSEWFLAFLMIFQNQSQLAVIYTQYLARHLNVSIDVSFWVNILGNAGQ